MEKCMRFVFAFAFHNKPINRQASERLPDISRQLRASVLKSWPNGLASRRKFWTCVQLAFRLATHLRGLVWTCDDLRGLVLTLVELKFGRK